MSLGLLPILCGMYFGFSSSEMMLAFLFPFPLGGVFVRYDKVKPALPFYKLSAIRLI